LEKNRHAEVLCRAERLCTGRGVRLTKQRRTVLELLCASDLGCGVRFSSVQDYFNLLCSDISDFPVARAVTASSAVPVLFDPVVIESYHDCKKTKPGWLFAAENRAAGDPEPEMDVSNKQPSLSETINAMSDEKSLRVPAKKIGTAC